MTTFISPDLDFCPGWCGKFATLRRETGLESNDSDMSIARVLLVNTLLSKRHFWKENEEPSEER
jgi:hypothetical protein